MTEYEIMGEKAVAAGEQMLARTLSCQEQLDFAREQFAKLVDAGMITLEEEVFDVATVMGFYGAMPAEASSGSERSDQDPKTVAYPWVRFAPARVNNKAQRQLTRTLERIEEMGEEIFAAEHAGLRDQWRQTYLRAQRPNLQVCRQLFQLLDDFYRVHRAPTYEVQLTIQDIDLDSSVLQCAGSAVFGALSRREQLAMLKLCRAEMQELGQFLQERFLASDGGRTYNKYVVPGVMEG